MIWAKVVWITHIWLGAEKYGTVNHLLSGNEDI